MPPRTFIPSTSDLVRVIRPALKELDEFHAVLYMLYHYYMPGDSLEQMKSSAVALKEKMVVLNKAVLPERLKSKEPAFAAGTPEAHHIRGRAGDDGTFQ